MALSQPNTRMMRVFPHSYFRGMLQCVAYTVAFAFGGLLTHYYNNFITASLIVNGTKQLVIIQDLTPFVQQ